MRSDSYTLAGLFLTLLVLCYTVNTHAAERFSKLVVFGDSLSDTGNIAIVDLPFPYFENRISNGPVLVDFLAASIGFTAEASQHLLAQPSGFNYSISGANVVGTDPEDLSSQIDTHLNRRQNQLDSRALYFVFIGGNDLRGIRGIRDQAIANTEVALLVDQLVAQLERLIEAGARRFLIPNLPNVGRIPETLDELPSDPSIAERADRISRLYNQQLAEKLAQLTDNAELRVLVPDLFTAFERILDTPTQFGFNNTRAGCFNVETFVIQFDCLIGDGFNQRVFFDSIHPSSATHQLLASMLFADLSSLTETANNNIPLPAIIDLLLTE